MTVAPGDDERPDGPETAGSSGRPGAAGGEPAGRAWRSNPSDDDVDAAFADIVSGMITDSVRRHPSGNGPTAGPPRPAPADLDRSAPASRPERDRTEPAGPDRVDPTGFDRIDRDRATFDPAELDPQDPPDPASERARRRELRRLERAAELAAFRSAQEHEQAERDADQEHYTPPDPPPLPRPRLRTVGSVLMILGGILLLARPGILAVGPDLALIFAVLLIVGGAVLLVTGIWRRRGGDGDGWDDGAVV